MQIINNKKSNGQYNLIKVHLIKVLWLYVIMSILSPLSLSYLDIPLSIIRSPLKTGQISLNLMIDIGGYQQNISLSLNNVQSDSITSLKEMKSVYKQLHKKHGKNKVGKNPQNVFGMIQASSLEGYSFEGWKRFFMETLLYVESRYYHDVQINLDHVNMETSKTTLNQGIITLGPKINQNKIYQQIKKNTQFINFDIISIYSGVGQRNVKLQLGGYQQEYAKGDSKTGALLYQFPLKVNDNYWQLAVEKVYFTRSKNKKMDQFLLNPNLSLYKLSLESQFIIFPESMKQAIDTFVQSQTNECSISQFLVCKNISTIDLSLSEFSFQLTPNYFINISLYDLKRDYNSQTKQASFYIKVSNLIGEIQIGTNILKQYYISIDMKQQTLLFSSINKFGTGLSTIFVLRFFIYFIIFTIVVAIFVGIWASFSHPIRRNKLLYGREGVQLITYQRPGAIFTPTSHQFDD